MVRAPQQVEWLPISQRHPLAVLVVAVCLLTMTSRVAHNDDDMQMRIDAQARAQADDVKSFH